MKLRELFEHFERMYKGVASSEETARALYGETASRDAKRISLYNHVRWMRIDDMTRAFPVTARVVGERWGELAYGFFLEHPWGSYDYRPAGAAFPAFLARASSGGPDAVPAWLPEVAALEWARGTASRSLAEPDPTGPLRLAPTVQLHVTAYDSARWLQPQHPAGEPPPRAGHAVTWRNLQGQGRAAPLDDAEHALLVAIREGDGLDRVPANSERLGKMLRSFLGGGVLEGDATELLAELPEVDAPLPTLGVELAAEYKLVAFAGVRWDDGVPQLWSPLVPDAITSDDPLLLAIAGELAGGKPIGAMLAAIAAPPQQVLEVADVLWSAGLIVPADHVAPAVAAGWDPSEAAVHALERQGAPTASPPLRPARATHALPPPGPLAPAPWSLAALASLLHHAAPAGPLRVLVRGDVPSLGPGVYRYRRDTHVLEHLDAAPAAPVQLDVAAHAAEAFAAGASLLDLAREGGAARERLRAAAEVLGLRTRAETTRATGEDPWLEPVVATLIVG